MKYLTCLVAMLALLAACTNTDEEEPAQACACSELEAESDSEPGPAPEPEEEKPADVTLGNLEAADAEEQTRAVEKIETVTGLKFKQAVPVYIYTPEELEEEVKGWGDGFTPDSILGFYKWSTKSLYMVPEAAGNKRAFGLRVHEACHALQDQHWDLAKLHGLVKTTDQDWAMLGLIEGHAVQVMIDALIADQPHVKFISMARAPEGSTNPDDYRNVYVYARGTNFIEALKNEGGYERVHKAFDEPPVSSEQILHPEKLIAGEQPDSIKLNVDGVEEALGEDWKLSEPDTLGEFETRMVFVQHEATVANSESIASGWGGDRFVTATKGEDEINLWVTTWDSAEEAKEFWEALQELPDVHQARWDETNDPRTVIVARTEAGPDHSWLAEVIEQLNKSIIEYHD